MYPFHQVLMLSEHSDLSGVLFAQGIKGIVPWLVGGGAIIILKYVFDHFVGSGLDSIFGDFWAKHFKKTIEVEEEDTSVSSAPDDLIFGQYLPANRAWITDSRTKELEILTNFVQNRKITVLYGLPGIGKTELVIRWAREQRRNGKKIYWVDYRDDINKTVMSLQLPGYQFQWRKGDTLEENNARQLRERVKYLQSLDEEDILILDGFDSDEAELQQRLSELEKLNLPMRTVVTTRSPSSGNLPELKKMNQRLLVALMRHYYKGKATEAELKKLIRAVESNTGLTVFMAQMLEYAEHDPKSKLTTERMLEVLNGAIPDSMGEEEYYYLSKQVQDQIQALFRLADLSEEERTLLTHALVFPKGGILESLLRLAEEQVSHSEATRECGVLYHMDNSIVERALPSLLNRGLLKRIGKDEKTLIRIEPMVWKSCWQVFKEEKGKIDLFLNGVRTVATPDTHYSHAFLGQAAEIFANALCQIDEKSAYYAYHAGFFYNHIAAYSDALSYCQKGIELVEKFGTDEKVVAHLYNGTGNAYGNLGDHEQALLYEQKALEIRKAVLPTNHPDLALSYNNVGVIYYCLGNYTQTLTHFQNAQRIWENRVNEPLSRKRLLGLYRDLETTAEAFDQPQTAELYRQKAQELCITYPDLQTE